MAYKIRNRMQPLFLPSIIDDYVAPDDPARVYDAFVDALNLNELGISLIPKKGADEYYPKDLLKLIIYSYSYGIRSSRKIERACYHNLSYQWLMGGLKPDYRTIARFRSEHKQAIKKILKQCVRMCIKLDLIEGNVLFIDGSKVRADASINKTYTKEKTGSIIKKVEEQIDQLLEDCERLDLQEDTQPPLIKLKEQIHEKAKIINKMKMVLSELDSTGKDSINLTDKDSVKAVSRQGTHACYSVQSTVDDKHGLIINVDAVSQQDDSNQLSPQVSQAIEVLGKKPKHVVADSKYSAVEDVKKVDPEINIIVPSLKQSQKEKGKSPIRPFDKEHFTYDESRDSYTCPEGNSLHFRNLTKEGHRNYQSPGLQCRQCRHFGNGFDQCTSSHSGRRVTRLKNELFKEQLEANYLKPENQAIYKKRKEKIEHPFGHWKRNLGAGQFMLRGKAKVDAESSILATCFNIRRMMTIIGIKGLITNFSMI